MSFLRLYSVALVFGVWSVLRFAGVQGDMVVGALLALAAVGVFVAEGERHRLVRKNRDGYRRREDDE